MKGISVNDILNVLETARGKTLYHTEDEFILLLQHISQIDTAIKLDWDNDAGEEWAELYYPHSDTVYKLHTKVGIVFTNTQNYNLIPQILLERCVVVQVVNMDAPIWKVSIKMLREKIPEITWHTSTDIVNPNCFSTSEFIYATM